MHGGILYSHSEYLCGYYSTIACAYYMYMLECLSIIPYGLDVVMYFSTER